MLQLQHTLKAHSLVDPGVAAKNVADIGGQVCHLNMPACNVSMTWAARHAPHHGRQVLDLLMLQAVALRGGRVFSMRQSSRASRIILSVQLGHDCRQGAC